MISRVMLQSQVPDDIHSIVAYLEHHNLDAADRFRAAIFPTLRQLAQSPGKGSPTVFRDKRLLNIRSWWIPGFRKYLIFYRPIKNGIFVLAVMHGSRNTRALLRKRS